MLMSVFPPSILGANVQEPVTRNGVKHADVMTRAGNSGANTGDKITANGANYDIILDGEKVGSFVFNKNSPYIEITITNDNALIEVIWSCSSKYANCLLDDAGVYKMPQLLQDNGKTQNFDAIWINVIDSDIDTDGDGLPDWLEIKYGMNPNNPDTLSDGILDGDRIFTVTQISKDWNPKDRVKPILNVQLQGKYIASLSIAKVPETDVFLCPLIPGYLGNAYDFNVDGSLVSATLTFEFASDFWNDLDFVPAIYYWNEEIQLLEELPDQTTTGNTVTVAIDHFSSYILLNKVPFDKVWEEEIRPPTSTGGGGEAKPLDIVFSIDSTGSMATNDPSGIRKDAAKNFVDKLGDNDLAAVVAFMTYAYLRTGFTSDKAELYRAIGTIDNSGSSTSNYRGLALALEQFDENSRDAHRYIIILTDGQDNDGPTNYTPLINEANGKDVTIFTIGLGSSVNTGLLRNIAESTGGKYYHASTAGELIDIFDEIADENIQTDTDEDGLPDYFEKLITEGELRGGNGVALIDYPTATTRICDPNNPDSDGDGLKDGEEVIIRSQLNPDGTTYKVWVYMFSNPCCKDTDGDGLMDNEDPTPLKAHDQRFERIFDASHRPADGIVDSNQASSNLVYRTDTPTFSDYANRETMRYVAQAGMNAFLWQFSSSLYHFLDNTGTLWEINAKDLMNQSPHAKKRLETNLNQLISASEMMVMDGETMIITTKDITLNEFNDVIYEPFYATTFSERGVVFNPSIHTHSEFDWFLTLGTSHAAMTCTVVKYGDHYFMSVKYYIDDFYDWKPTYNGGAFSAPSIFGPVGVTHSDLYHLHVVGYAQQYRVSGCYEALITWSTGQRFGLGATQPALMEV